MASRSIFPSATNSLDTVEESCAICYSNAATHEYDPCGYSPMCGECFAKLTQQQCEECIICRRRATINSRVTISSRRMICSK